MDHPRALTPQDAEAYCALRREMLLDTPHAFLGAPGDDRPSDVAFVRDQLTQAEMATFAIDDPEGDGLLSVATIMRMGRTKQRHRAMIVAVYTTPRGRGRGLGRAVVQACIDHARMWSGVEIVMLSASADAEGAVRLYERMGFERWGVEPDAIRVDGTPHDEVHLLLRLS
ncbi:MAG: GNAT family protein [Planctomycetota bacterium]